MDTIQHTINTVTETVTTDTSYSATVLCIIGMVGILLHNLIKIDSLNRKGQASINLGKYLQVEIVTIIISVIVVLLGVFFLQRELKQYFEIFQQYMGIGFLFLGYFAQSILVKTAGRGEKYIDDLNKPDTDNP